MAARKRPFWASIFIPDIGNGDSNIIDPGNSKQESGWIVEKPLLQNMNWIQNLFGKYITSNNHIDIIDDGEELEAGDRKFANNSSAPCTILLPADPEDGQWIEIGGATLYSTNAVTMDGGTNAIMIGGDFTCELDSESDGSVFRFWWCASTSLWCIRITSLEGKV
ncbi:MAG: hypothetical protein HRU12_10085 [Phaeodactylibacter sp.]|nr:hypothetical protein [Phaeodactylibacter sp.]